jgi:O-antigen/teichoic acid export membrane protein
MIVFFIPILLNWFSFDQYAWAYVASFIIIGLLMLGFVGWRGEIKLKPSSKLWDGKLLKAIASISGFGLLTGLNNVLILQVNNIFIDRYYDEALTGIYVTNFFFAALILMPSRGLNKIAPTIISDAFKDHDLKSINSVQYKSTINQFMIGLLIFMGLIINLHHVYQILPESYSIGIWVIVITGLANLIQMLGGISSAIIGFSNYYRYNTLLSVIQLVVLVVANIIALPLWGITGAAVATLSAVLVLNILKFIFLKKKFGIQPYSSKHLLIIVIALLCWGVNALLPDLSNLYLDIIYRSLIFTILYGILNYFLEISRDMNNTINKTFEKLRIR